MLYLILRHCSTLLPLFFKKRKLGSSYFAVLGYFDNYFKKAQKDDEDGGEEDNDSGCGKNGERCRLLTLKKNNLNLFCV